MLNVSEGGCLGDGVRWVGDPVDVVTGALVEAATEFTVAGPLPIVWTRHYSSALAGTPGPLGWGSQAGYALSLRAVVDGWLVTWPDGGVLLFPHDAPAQAQRGWRLVQEGALHRLRAPDGALYEFRAARAGAVEGPERLVRGSQALLLAYDGAGRLIEISEPGRARVVTVDRREAQIDALMLTRHPQREDGRALALMRYEYDGRGDMVAAVDRYGHRRVYQYDAEHRMVARTDRDGYRFVYEYDAEGRCVASGGHDGVRAVRLRYMPEAQATVVRHADGGEWLHRYDASRSITEIIDPYGGVRRFEYDTEGRLTRETDAAGDSRGALRSASGELLAWRTGRGGLRPVDEPSGPLPHSVPDSVCALELGRLAARVRAAAPLASPGLEPPLLLGGSSYSRLFADRDPRGEASCRRDELGLLLQESPDPQAPARRWAYTPNGWVRHYTDASGGRYDFEYQGWNHRVAVRDPLARTIRYEYTALEKISAATDPAGNRHTYRYDLRGELTEVHHSGALTETYEHDVAGRMTARRDCHGALLTRYEYGPDGLASLRALADGEVHRYTYTPAGQLAQVDYDEHGLTFAYTAAGRRRRDMRDGQGVEHEYEAGRLARTCVLGRFTTQYRWRDEATLELEDPTGQRHVITFGSNGTVTRQLACGVQELADYDSLGRCRGKHLFSAVPGAPVWRRTFEYGPEGDLLAEHDSETGRTVIRHDAAHQISEVEHPDGRRDRYRYDLGGNLVEAPHLEGVEVEAGNRLLTACGARFAYDHRGNVATWAEPGRTRSFHRDALDRLRRIDGLGAAWTAEYDPLGRRTHKTHGDERTEYFWDTDRLAAQRQHDGGLRVYVYMDDFALLPWLVIDYDSVDADPASGRVHTLLSDQRGAPVAALDAQGQRVWSTSLAPYGLASRRAGAVVNSWDPSLGLAGQIRDPETGLHYHRFRYYSPELGRYLEEDPTGTGGGLNLYAFTHNPLVQFDPRGLMCKIHGEEEYECPDKKEAEEKAGSAKANEDEAISVEMDRLAQDAWQRIKAAYENGERTATLADGTVVKVRTGSGPQDRGPCLTIVKDMVTGDIFYVQNTGKVPKGLVDPLGPRTVDMAKKNQAASPAPESHPLGWSRKLGIPGSHSEVQATNQALSKRPGALLEELAIYNVRTENIDLDIAPPMPRCANCKVITDGAHALTD